MLAITILYPKTDGSKFDMDYYAGSHMPMFTDSLGEACQGWGVIAPHGGDYHAIGWAMVTSQDAFNSAMAEHGAKIMGDVANYTDVQPAVVLGDVVK